MTTALFTSDDLGAWLRQPVSAEAAEVVERVVWGWLRPLLNVTERPDQPSAELEAWAIELGAIAYANPEGLDSKKTGPFGEDYSSERRDEILLAVAGGGTTAPGAAPKPVGCFPPPRRYPDPAQRCW